MANPTILIREITRILKVLQDIRTEIRGLRDDLRRYHNDASMAPSGQQFTKDSHNNGYQNGGVRKGLSK